MRPQPVRVALCGHGTLFEHAFSGKTVDDVALDPCALIVVSKWSSEEMEQREQQFFTHARCLLAGLHPDVRSEADVLDPQSDLYRSAH
ncbi:hypothetical protein GCM10022262_39740 [Georgenia daeguensis]|uniref:Uncharacterized protein n=1 Tax=Georgenia daeguensis TaxID=908355 RepID=A0ABP6ULL0_9MICO